MTDSQPELVAQERAAMVAWRLADGAGMTTRDVADCVGLQLRGAYHMMNKLMKVLPIRLDGRGRWVRDDSLRPSLRQRVKQIPPSG